MRIGMLGTGTVGRTIATKLVELGHEVRMGSRAAGNEASRAWSAGLGDAASEGTFADAGQFGELAFNCTAGAGALEAVALASEALVGKLLIDVCNPLEFSGGSPSLFVGITDSLGEQIQRALPNTSVVKALNTVNADVMVDPGIVPGDHVLFVCGDDAGAKARTVARSRVRRGAIPGPIGRAGRGASCCGRRPTSPPKSAPVPVLQLLRFRVASSRAAEAMCSSPDLPTG